VPRVRAEGHLSRRAAAGARPELVVDDEAKLAEIGNALGDDAPAQAGTGDELRP
jgi:hypothetical protein